MENQYFGYFSRSWLVTHRHDFIIIIIRGSNMSKQENRSLILRLFVSAIWNPFKGYIVQQNRREGSSDAILILMTPNWLNFTSTFRFSSRKSVFLPFHPFPSIDAYQLHAFVSKILSTQLRILPFWKSLGILSLVFWPRHFNPSWPSC